MELKARKPLNAVNARLASNMSAKEILKSLDISDEVIAALLASPGKINLSTLKATAAEKDILSKLNLGAIDKINSVEGASRLLAIANEKISKGEIAVCCH